MCEVLFRGKRTDNGEWITDSETYIRDGDGIWLSDKNLHVVTVIPETVGQYTGLTDKNGKRIFEGDIVDYISSDVIGNPKTGTIIVEDMTDYDTMIYLNHSDELQIIGNIHDNPELLREASKPIAQDILTSATGEGEDYIMGFTLMQG